MGRTKLYRRIRHKLKYFNSLAPYGANHKRGKLMFSGLAFQLTRPVWGEPVNIESLSEVREYFNSLAPYGANPIKTITHLFR